MSATTATTFNDETPLTPSPQDNDDDLAKVDEMMIALEEDMDTAVQELQLMFSNIHTS